MTLPCCYLPSVAWFAHALRRSGGYPSVPSPLTITLEAHENYPKQAHRNRCYIDSPNGTIALTVPIDRSNFSEQGKCLMQEVRISSQYDWRHQHWQALASTYYNSPFFEFLQDDFRPLYARQWTYLMDLNEALIERCFALIDVSVALQRTTHYVGAEEIAARTTTPPYYQVFAAKHGFAANLSIVDLLFNMGNDAPLYL